MTADTAQAESGLLALLAGARVIDLEQPRFQGMPMFPANNPNYTFMLHRRHEAGLESRTSAGGMILTADHAGTHVDALCHQAENMMMHGGIPVSSANQGPAGLNVLTAETLPPIIRRGVLIDLVAARGGRLPARYLVERDELAAVADQQGVHVRPGDVLLIHTGWGAAWHDPDYITGGGMARSSGEWAVEQQVYAVGADNMSWDLPGYTDPVLGHTLPNHTLLLVRAGILIFENLLLEDLAATGTREFAFVSLPLKLVGATGAPTRPVALIPPDPQEGQ
ncbi:MAG: cyclase family protein [Trebonia sp.]